IQLMVARQRRRGVEVQAERGPPVGSDQVCLRTEAFGAADLGQERTSFERDADAGLALQRATAQDAFEEDGGVEDPDQRLPHGGLQAEKVLEVDYQLQSPRDAEVEHGG